MDVEPESGALLEEFAEFERHFRSDAAASEHDFLDALRADAEGSRKGVLGDAHGDEVVFQKNFTGGYGGFHLENFISRKILNVDRKKHQH